jgi:hypothetical protein
MGRWQKELPVASLAGKEVGKEAKKHAFETSFPPVSHFL